MNGSPQDPAGPTAGGPAGQEGVPDGQGLHGPAGGPAGAGPGRVGTASRRRAKKKGRSFWAELPILVVVALALTLIIKTYAFQAFYIPSGSMQNTLGIGDRVLVNKVVYDIRGIHRGDIVVFSGDGTWNPETPAPSANFLARLGENAQSMFGLSRDQNDYIKRVIGLPGDHVACCDARGRVTVDSVPLNEQSYLYPGNPPSEQRFSVTVPSGSLWVMGDHRDVSYDSRGHVGYPGGGAIPESSVVGRAFVVIWPVRQWGILNIPATFEQPKLNASMGSRTARARSPQETAALPAGAMLHPAAPALPYALGFAGAVPLTWFQRRLRRAARRRLRR